METQSSHLFQHDFDGMYNGCLRLDEMAVDRVLTPVMARQAVLDALKCHANGEFVQPLKVYTRPRGRFDEYAGGRFIAMPAYVGPPIDAVGIKWIAGFPRNCEIGMPRASAKLLLNCTLTGRVIAEMDSAVLSARRTAAVAAISVQHLAVDKNLTVAILGAGPICHSVIEALLALGKPICSIRVFDPQESRVEMVQRGFADTGCPVIVAATSAEACVQRADVVIAATSGASSYIERHWISPGTLLVMLSLNDPTPELFLGADKVITDDFEQCCREDKLIHRLVFDGRFSRRQIHAELGEIVSGKVVGREYSDEIILINPMGMAIEDVAVGKAVYVAAKQMGIGEYCPAQIRDDLPDGFLFRPHVPFQKIPQSAQ